MKVKISETDIKRQIKDLLAIKHIFNFHLLQGLGCYPGIPDRMIHHKGKVIYLEIKKPGGKMSEHQLVFRSQCIEDKIEYWCVSSTEGLEELLK